jgi:hypothetical protein
LLILVFVLLLFQVLGPSTLPLEHQFGRLRAYTRSIEFNYLRWTLEALWVKVNQTALGLSNYFDAEKQRQVVFEYLDLVEQIQAGERHLNDIYTDPDVVDVENSSELVRGQLESLYDERSRLGPLAESVFQNQLSAVAAEMGLSLGGQPVPPVFFRSTPLPWALIVSPREVIQLTANVSLRTDLTVDEHAVLEEEVDEALDVSSLVVPIGGVGLYPSMVAQSTNLNWIAEVVAHEWIHNYLTLRPLGVLYEASAEMRTINETTANLAGKELGAAIIERFYPEFVPPPPPPPPPEGTTPSPEPEPPIFDFREEMHTTRIVTDELLSEGKIEGAEAYMEERRVMFWENGYRIRKLNQAYFAFHGAYADVPGGAAPAEDPVGAAVRELREKSISLAKFVNRISWVISFDGLVKVLEKLP